MTTSETDVDFKVDDAAGRHSVHRFVGHSLWRHLDLFSGIGGFALACRMVGGIETVGFCEREPYAQRVLKKHWPDVPICNDIHEMKGNDYGTIDLITGGFPCQPYSLAGERRGNEDDRALWPQMLRVISEARPAWVLGENVPGIITLALDGVLADMEAQGYACETLCIPACGVDARHRRERIWIVGHSTKRGWNGAPSTRSGKHQGEWTQPAGRSSRALADTTGGQNLGRECRDLAEASGCWRRGNASADSGREDVANGDDSGRQERRGAKSVRQEYSPAERGCAWRPETEWLAESGMGRVAHGIPARVDRLRGLGNAIVPQVAAEIIAAMKRVDIVANRVDMQHAAEAGWGEVDGGKGDAEVGA
jgi:DNA (cytosine-5)-methyltransferase 1